MVENEEQWDPKVIGAIVGLIVGLVMVFAGTLNAFIVAALIFGGWIVGKCISGEIDVDDIYDRYLRGRLGGSER